MMNNINQFAVGVKVKLCDCLKTQSWYCPKVRIVTQIETEEGVMVDIPIIYEGKEIYNIHIDNLIIFTQLMEFEIFYNNEY